MKILIVTPYFYPAESFGGPVKVAYDVGKELVKQGHEVVVYTSDAKDLRNRLPSGCFNIEGMRVYYFKNLSMFSVKHSKLFITLQLNSVLASEINSFDVIHVHEYTTYQNIVVHKLAKKYGIPYIVQAHGSLPNEGSRKARRFAYDLFFGKEILKDASRVIALNRLESEKYQVAGVPLGKIAIIPNGIETPNLHNIPPKGVFKRKYKINGNQKIILYLGRIHKSKRIDILVKSFKYVIDNLNCIDSLLVIAGPDDGYLAELISIVNSYGLSRFVLFVGFISNEDKLAALVDADVFATPSFSGFPMTFLESCAVGTPIVTTTLGDDLGWIDRVGFVKSPTEIAFGEAIGQILLNDSLHDKFSRNCSFVLNAFSLKSVASKLEALYLQTRDN